MQTNVEAARETPQTETIPEVTPPMQTNVEAARETPQTETIPEVTPPMQTNVEAARETPQTETIPEATPPMQTNVEAAGETPQTETIGSLNHLASPVEVASLPRLRPFLQGLRRAELFDASKRRQAKELSSNSIAMPLHPPLPVRRTPAELSPARARMFAIRRRGPPYYEQCPGERSCRYSLVATAGCRLAKMCPWAGSILVC